MIGSGSRYEGSVLYVDGGEEFIGARSRIETAPEPDDVFHTVTEGDRIDLIAYRYLGSAELWWIICDYNDISFPLEIRVGVVLRIPSAEHVEMRLTI
jgi:nucleoid-associated protein YgaU